MRATRQEFCVFAALAGPFWFMKVLIVIRLAFIMTSLLAQTPGPGISSGKHPFTFEDMMKLKRVGAPVPSPDGKWVAFDCEDVDLEANTKISHLWIVPASGGESRRLNPTQNHEERPRFSPDGKRLIWTSKATDPTQIWMCDFDASAGALVGQPHQVTHISPAQTARSGHRMERTLCSCRRCIRIARMMLATSSAMTS
jgi:dipeptidyl aminopeptidase/acylaminoacyl peptidase